LPTQNIIANNIRAIRSGIDLLSNITSAEYNYIAEPYFSASTGKHFRHILDHYTCFIEGLPVNRIDYDIRRRDSHLETDLHTAIKYSEDIIAQLKSLAGKLQNQRGLPESSLQVNQCTSVEDNVTQPVKSSLERELTFIHSHTTHHFSIIGAILKLQNHTIDADFGVAPSTLIYQEHELEAEQNKCAL
jgi:hypothetical protein